MSLNYRLYDNTSQKMYNFVRGFMDYKWTVWDDVDLDMTMWKDKVLFDDHVEIQEYIGKHDDTKWSQLQEKEKEFWSMKGYSEDTWTGKEMFEGDICKRDCGGVTEKVFVVKVEHETVLLTKEETVKDIPIHNYTCQLYVIGNVLENPLLLTNEDMLFERRSMVERRKGLRNFPERRTSEESIVN